MGAENIFQDGPYLNGAFLCEKVLEEKDGVKSAIRIIDRITMSAAGEAAPPRMPPLPVAATLLLRVKTGKKPGRHQFKVELVKPDGTRSPGTIMSVDLEGPEDRGADLKMDIRILLESDGSYWFDIYCDDILMTRVPLRVIYITQKRGSGQQVGLIQ
jgi:hypothetical protein